MFRYTKSIIHLRQSLEILEKDINELNLSAKQKKERINDLARLLKDANELIPQKDEQVHQMRQEKSILEKNLDVLKDGIVDLKKNIENLLLEIRNQHQIIEMVIRFYYVYNIIIFDLFTIPIYVYNYISVERKRVCRYD